MFSSSLKSVTRWGIIIMWSLVMHKHFWGNGNIRYGSKVSHTLPGHWFGISGVVFIEKKIFKLWQTATSCSNCCSWSHGSQVSSFPQSCWNRHCCKTEGRIKSVCFGFTFLHSMKNRAETLKTMKIMLRLGLGTICHCVCLRERVQKRQGERGN